MLKKSTKSTNTKDLEKQEGKSIQKRREQLMIMLTKIVSQNERENIEKVGLEELEKIQAGEKKFDFDPKGPIPQLLSLYEFDNAVLLCSGLNKVFHAFVTDLSLNIQREYKCESASEKATAHLVAQNYVRTLEVQREIRLILNRDSYSDLVMKRYSILSKEYDRANRQYLMSLQQLQNMKLPPLNVSVKAQVANIGNQQLIKQDSYEEKP